LAPWKETLSWKTPACDSADVLVPLQPDGAALTPSIVAKVPATIAFVTRVRRFMKDLARVEMRDCARTLPD
jgi:hypothetical protein